MTDRRAAVPFDPEYFARRAEAGEVASLLERFRRIYETHHWSGSRSRSGAGADVDQTARIRAQLPDLCRALGVTSLLDLPCGDFSWMRDVPLEGVDYTGADLLPEIIATNRERYESPTRHFVTLDITDSTLPVADLLLCRDCFVHLSFADVARALRNIARSGIAYLLTTTFSEQEANIDIVSGDWRPLDLEQPPFALPRPLVLLNEGCTEGGGQFADKCLGLWRVSELSKAAVATEPEHRAGEG